ncbi:MAG: hypothetical protein H7Z40_14500, partial [Phycisphaerae bacterium]|nr:hypothetical protein [Gemmatimonadaceae bacterium]
SLLAPGAATSTAIAQTPAQARPAATLTAVVGNWMTVDDGGPAWRMDGGVWDGTTDRARIESLSKSLFSQANSSFVTHATAPGAFPFAIARTSGEISNGTLSVAFKMIGGASDQNAGIMFGLRPNGDYHFVRYNTKDGNVAVWEYVNGERKVLAKGVVEKQLPMNAWHDLVVTIRNGNVQGSVLGTDMRVEHSLGASTLGRVGVWTKRDAITVFRNFRVAP